jgi:hypothetical protein
MAGKNWPALAHESTSVAREPALAAPSLLLVRLITARQLLVSGAPGSLVLRDEFSASQPVPSPGAGKPVGDLELRQRRLYLFGELARAV